MSTQLRVAVISDIHGNLGALRAVLADIDARGRFDHVIVAGDHCLNGPDPDATLDLAMERGSVLLKGNTDRDIVEEGASDPEIGDKKRASIAWTREQLGTERIAVLDRLQFDTPVVAPDDTELLVVHANPLNLDDHIFPDMEDDQLEQLVGNAQASVLVFGHLHIPNHRSFRSLQLFNIASVGLPRDGDRRAVWGSFEWSTQEGWTGTIHRTAYDVADTVLRILESGMPHTERRIRDVVRATYD